MLLTKVEKLLFLLLPMGGLTGLPSSDSRFVFGGLSFSERFTRLSIRLNAEKLADCRSVWGPRESELVCLKPASFF